MGRSGAIQLTAEPFGPWTCAEMISNLS